MPDSIREFFETQISPDAPPVHSDRTAEERHRLAVAACALLLEMAHADDEFSDAERKHIGSVVRRHFGLLEAGAQELIALAESERSQARDLYQFTSLIRQSYDPLRKRHLVENLWAIALSDGKIAQHESYMMDRIGALLDLPADELAQARQSAESKTLSP